MYKLIRYFNQNRKRIIIIIIGIVFFLGLIQLLNYFAKNSNSSNNNVIEKDTVVNNELVSNKSAVSGSNIAQQKLKRDTDIITKFMDYCNLGKVEEAYNLLTDECKEEMYPNVQQFKEIYFDELFNEEKKNYTIQNWTGSIYEVRVTDDILSTGKIDNTVTKQDYITVVSSENEYKLNINSYVGRKKVEEETTYKDIKIVVTQIDTYMDYQTYNLTIENNSNNSIKLDTNDDTKSIYLLDNNDHSYYFYNNEINENKLIVQSKYKNTLKIKFMNPYVSSKRIKKLVFSKMILNYDEYKNLEDKTQYKSFIQFDINI